jgi:hyperosmotically inducible protein
MTSRKIAALIAGLALTAFAVGCNGDNANNANNTNNANANRAIVNTNTNTNTNTTANANTNANKAPTREEVDKNKETYGQQAKSSGRKIGTGTSDTWLWVKTKYDLAAADDLRDSTINVDVENGVVTLSGDVANNDQVKKADSIAKSVEGVKSVKNMLKVAANGANANRANANANTNTKTANANAGKH